MALFLLLLSHFLVVGITFSDAPLIRYSFLGTSIVLSVIDAFKRSKKK